ncbi:MAG: FAD-dependent oxidoreductase, partial [Pseudomonadota bacterium]
MEAKRLLVIGNGMVGQRLLENLAAGRHDYAITVLCEEPRPAYDRVGLTSFFSGRTAEDLSLVPPRFFEDNGITLHLCERAEAIDRTARRVTTSSGRVLEYDRLVLATGSSPFVPPIPGRERPQCFVYRTIEDLVAIREAARHARSG